MFDSDVFNFIMIILGILFIIFLLKIVGEWLMFKKAGREGWAALIPIYNEYILCKIVGVNPWWIAVIYLISFVPLIGGIVAPIASLYFYAILYVSTARSYGKSDTFAIGLWFLTPIFMLVLGCDSSEYIGEKPMSDPIFEALGINKKEIVKEAEVVKEKSNNLKYCPNCGSEVIENSKFCVSCGKEL